jgi:hypothetical protein
VGIDDYSSRSLATLLAVFPEFEDFIQEKPDESIFIETTSPSGSRLWVSTEGAEVTVGFDCHHRHFGQPWHPEREPEQDVEEAIEYIRELMSRRYLIAVWTRNGKFVMSSTVQQGDVPSPTSWIGRWWLKGCTVDLKGW